jgi:hypothetical protein
MWVVIILRPGLQISVYFIHLFLSKCLNQWFKKKLVVLGFELGALHLPGIHSITLSHISRPIFEIESLFLSRSAWTAVSPFLASLHSWNDTVLSYWFRWDLMNFCPGCLEPWSPQLNFPSSWDYLWATDAWLNQWFLTSIFLSYRIFHRVTCKLWSVYNIYLSTSENHVCRTVVSGILLSYS